MAITLEELVVRIRSDIGDTERRIQSVDRAVSRMGRGGTSASREWAGGMREVIQSSERMATDTIRAAERAGDGAVRAARTAANEQTRLARTLAREQEQASRRAEAAQRRSLAIQTQLAGDIGRGMMLAGAGMAGGLALAAKQAISFESAFTGVRKTVDGSEAELASLEKQLRQMATSEVPLPLEQLAKIAEMGGQLGIATKDLKEFTRVTAEMAASTDLSFEGAAEGMARISNVMGLTAKDFRALGSTIVDVGNKSAAGEREIVEFAQRLTGAGNVANVATADLIGFSAAMASVGINAEAGGTAFSRVIKDIADAAATGGKELNQFAQIAGVSSTKFRELFKKDAGRAIALFVEGLATLRKEGKNLFPILEGLGFKDARVADTLLRLAGQQGLVTKALNDARPAWARQNALGDEAGKKFKTTESQLRFFGNQVREAGAKIGVHLLPMLRDALRTFDQWLTAFSSLDPAAQKFITTTALIGSAVLLLGGRILGTIGSVLQLRTALAGLTAANATAAASGALTGGGAAAAGAGAAAAAAARGALRPGLTAGVTIGLTPAAEDLGTAGGNLVGDMLGLPKFTPKKIIPSPGDVIRKGASLVGGLFKPKEAPRAPASMGELRASEGRDPTLIAAEQARKKVAADQAQAMREIRESTKGLGGATPSVPKFDTKESKAAAKKAAGAASKAAREAQRLAEERARNLASQRQDLAIEQMLARGQTRQAFIEQNRKPGVSDALSGKMFDTRQFRQAQDEARRNQAEFAKRRAEEAALAAGDEFEAFRIREARPGIATDDLRKQFKDQQDKEAQDRRDEQEKQGRDALAQSLVQMDTQRQSEGLRRQGFHQDADFLEFVRGNEQINTLLAAQPGLLDHVRSVFDRGWIDAHKVDATNDGMKELNEQLRQATREANRAAKGTPLSIDEQFEQFGRENKAVGEAFLRGDFAAVAKSRDFFGTQKDADRGRDKALLLKEITDELTLQKRLLAATPAEAFAIGLERKDDKGNLIKPDPEAARSIFFQKQQMERDQMTAQSRAELDQRRRGVTGSDFDRFAISREQIDEQGRTKQPFDMKELKEQFKLMQQITMMEEGISATRDIFLQAFMDMGSGAKGFFSSLVSGLQQTLTRMAAEILSAQATKLLTNLAVDLIGGSIGGGAKGFQGTGTPGGSTPMIPHLAMGGPVDRGRPVLVGEEGPELFVPHVAGKIVPAGAGAGAAGGGGGSVTTIHMTINTPDAGSFRKSQGQIVAEMSRKLDQSRARGL